MQAEMPCHLIKYPSAQYEVVQRLIYIEPSIACHSESNSISVYLHVCNYNPTTITSRMTWCTEQCHYTGCAVKGESIEASTLACTIVRLSAPAPVHTIQWIKAEYAIRGLQRSNFEQEIGRRRKEEATWALGNAGRGEGAGRGGRRRGGDSVERHVKAAAAAWRVEDWCGLWIRRGKGGPEKEIAGRQRGLWSRGRAGLGSIVTPSCGMQTGL
jgi:hypothetical protein